MNAVATWFISLAMVAGVFAWAIRRSGRSLAWVGAHFAELVVAAFAVTLGVAWGGSKPPPPPGPPSPSGTNAPVRIPAGLSPDGRVIPYGSPLKWR